MEILLGYKSALHLSEARPWWPSACKGEGSARCCLTCSSRRRRPIVPMSSTLACWLSGWPWQRTGSAPQELRDVPIGYFGASTGAGAALVAETLTRHRIAAIVSRGGRPDLAGTALPRVQAPTLLIIGGADSGVIELNEEALA